MYYYLLLKAFANVGIDYAQLCNEPAVLEKCQEIATNASWGVKLGRLKVRKVEDGASSFGCRGLVGPLNVCFFVR